MVFIVSFYFQVRFYRIQKQQKILIIYDLALCHTEFSGKFSGKLFWFPKFTHLYIPDEMIFQIRTLNLYVYM